LQRYFKYYLCGPPFTVTDHAALKWLMTFKEPEGQVTRWLEELQAFRFTMEHRAGASHTDVNAFSQTGASTVSGERPERENCRKRRRSVPPLRRGR